MFCAFACARSAEDNVNTQLITKNITVRTIRICADAKIREHFCSASSPYSSRFATENAEIIGEWLKANTMTGIVNQMVIQML